MANFDEVKARVTCEQAIAKLGLTMTRKSNQWRMACPACKASDPRSLCVTEGKGFYCWASGAKGSVIDLVAHIRDCSVPQAANFLAGTVDTSTVGGKRTSTVPESVPKGSPQRGEEPKGLAPLTYLEPSHEAVEALGFDPEFAKQHGIGWAPRGTAKGHVLIPFRDEDGALLGYVGMTGEVWLPNDFKTNVVKFPKTA